MQRDAASKSSLPRRGEYNVYSTFQSHEPEFDYLKSLEIEEKINKIRWLRRKNPAHFLLSTNGNTTEHSAAGFWVSSFVDKTIKLWKVSERDKRAEGYNLKEDSGVIRDPSSITTLKVPVLKPMELMVEASMCFVTFSARKISKYVICRSVSQSIMLRTAFKVFEKR